MAQFKAFIPEIEVNGQTVYAVVDGMGVHKRRAFQILADNGINDPQPSQWCRQQDWLDGFREIAQSLGPSILFQIGRNIPENADWPAQILMGSVLRQAQHKYISSIFY